jgi:hypothetical protein
MGATFERNQVLDTKRRADLIIYADSGDLAEPGVDFMALGLVWFKGATVKYAAALGTLTNNRRPLTVADFTITATDTTAETTTKVAHGLRTGDGPLRPTTTAGGFTSGVDYYPIYVDADKVKWATSLTNAYAGTNINITADVTGMVFQDVPGTTERGVPGHFTYEASQGETDVATSEYAVLIDGTGYARRNNAGAYTTIGGTPALKGFDDTGEGAHTYGDLQRLMVAVLCGEALDFETGTQIFRSLDDTKTRLTGTTTANGRTAITVGDLTP